MSKFKEGDIVRFTPESESQNIGKELRVLEVCLGCYRVECEDGIYLTDGDICYHSYIRRERAEKELEILKRYKFKDIPFPRKLETPERTPNNHGDMFDHWTIKREGNNSYLCFAQRGRLILEVWKNMNREEYPEKYLMIFDSQESAWDYVNEHSSLLDGGDVEVVPTYKITGCV